MVMVSYKRVKVLLGPDGIRNFKFEGYTGVEDSVIAMKSNAQRKFALYVRGLSVTTSFVLSFPSCKMCVVRMHSIQYKGNPMSISPGLYWELNLKESSAEVSIIHKGLLT